MKLSKLLLFLLLLRLLVLMLLLRRLVLLLLLLAKAKTDAATRTVVASMAAMVAQMVRQKPSWVDSTLVKQSVGGVLVEPSLPFSFSCKCQMLVQDRTMAWGMPQTCLLQWGAGMHVTVCKGTLYHKT